MILKESKKELFQKLFNIKTTQFVDDICDLSVIRTLKKGDYLFRAGDNHHYISFLIEGLVKRISIDIEGSEHIDSIFSSMDSICTHPLVDPGFNLFDLKPARTSCVTITNVKILSIRTDFLPQVLFKYPEANVIVSQIYQDAMIYYSERDSVFRAFKLNLKGLYEHYMINHPYIFANTMQNDLASFFGCSVYQLSRVKKELLTENPHYADISIRYKCT